MRCVSEASACTTKRDIHRLVLAPRSDKRRAVQLKLHERTVQRPPRSSLTYSFNIQVVLRLLGHVLCNR